MAEQTALSDQGTRHQYAPTRKGRLAKREARLAYWMLAPTLVIVLSIVLFPLLANIWISFKPIQLADLRPATPSINERLLNDDDGTLQVRYRLRNPSSEHEIKDVVFTDVIQGQTNLVVPPECSLQADILTCRLDVLAPRERKDFFISGFIEDGTINALASSQATVSGSSPNVLTTFSLGIQNFEKITTSDDFWNVVGTSIYYTVFGTAGALVLGLFAALLLQTSFRGRTVLRGLFLFPYVAPVIAVAFAWVILLDAGPGGTLNALLMSTGTIDQPINFLGQRSFEFVLFGISFNFPLALTTVIAFEAWRYFPLSFLFILARMQSISSDIYEAAEMDGATPLQQFRYLSLPQLAGILAVLFLLRFIWTFNKFDDIFLLTGGAAGTRTLTVDVYQQAFALSDLGAGAAVAVIIFVFLLSFSLLFLRLAPRDDG